MIKSITSLLTATSVSLLPHFSEAQDLSGFPLYMGTPVETEDRVPHSSPQSILRPNQSFGDLSKPRPQLIQREPVFIFMNAAQGQNWTRFMACTSDGGEFQIDLALRAEISAVNYQIRLLREDGYKERVEKIKNA